MFSSLSLRRVLANNTTTMTPQGPSSFLSIPSRLFSSTTSLLARKAPGRPAPGGAKKGPPTAKRLRNVQRSEAYYRIAILKQNLFSPAPPPLRMARLRHLRHWTIHRAWMLLRRQQKEAVDAERGRMHAGMYNACEELRKTVGPAGRGEGYLYRVAMEKKGVWHMGSVPIEYARFQTDSPAKQAWDHDWKR